MSFKQSIAHYSIVGSEAFSGSALGRRWPFEYMARLLSNHGVPRLAKMAFRPGWQDVNGARMWIAPSKSGGAGGEYHMALGTYEKYEIAYVTKKVPSGGGFIDLGAHIGYFTLAVAAHVGSAGTVLAVEPTASSAEILRKNVSANGFDDRVTVVEAAASDHVGTGSLIVSSVSEMWNTLEPDTLDSTDSAAAVDLVTIDSIAEAAGWPPFHLCKLDVEGHERAALAGGTQVLDRNPDIEILFEASGTSDERVRVSLDTMSFLQDFGFSFFSIERGGNRCERTIDELEQRMGSDRWQDSLFNVIAIRKTVAADVSSR